MFYFLFSFVLILLFGVVFDLLEWFVLDMVWSFWHAYAVPPCIGMGVVIQGMTGLKEGRGGVSEVRNWACSCRRAWAQKRAVFSRPFAYTP